MATDRLTGEAPSAASCGSPEARAVLRPLAGISGTMRCAECPPPVAPTEASFGSGGRAGRLACRHTWSDGTSARGRSLCPLRPEAALALSRVIVAIHRRLARKHAAMD